MYDDDDDDSQVTGGGKKKSNGHKAACKCPICKNMKMNQISTEKIGSFFGLTK